MINDLMFCINAVLPMFIAIAIGYFLKFIDVLDSHSLKKINGLVFKCALPVLLFMDIYKSDFIQFLDPGLTCLCILITLISFFTVWIFAEIFIKEKFSIGAFVQGACRSNYAVMGMALISSIMGEEVQGKGVIVLALVIPLYNVLSVFVLSMHNKTHTNGNDLIKEALKSICKNPLIIGILIGIIFSVFNIELPHVVESSLTYFYSLATPLALISIGGALDFKKGRAKIKLAAVAALIKLIVIPLVFGSLTIALGFRGEELLVVAVLSASPTAVSSYIMAAELGSDEVLASNIVLLTTLFSIVTYTLGLYYFRLTGLM